MAESDDGDGVDAAAITLAVPEVEAAGPPVAAAAAPEEKVGQADAGTEYGALSPKELAQVDTLGINFNRFLHVQAPETDEESRPLCSREDKLREAITQLQSCRDANERTRDTICEFDNLRRMLRARKNKVDKATHLADQTLIWRNDKRPDLIRADAAMEHEACTGKARLADGLDRFGRPVIILDSSCENTTDVDAQMRFLTYNMERSIRRMRTSPNDKVEKHVVFIYLDRFSIWNAPGMGTTKRTISILSQFYCERLGHGILYQPPAYFAVFLRAVRPFIDPVTYGKVVIIKGDCDPGSANDQKMCLLMGENWREITGINKPKQNDQSSPGYDHAVAWAAAVAEDEAAHQAVGEAPA